jgi:hypothetical protein
MRLRALAIFTFLLAILASVIGPLRADAVSETVFGSTVPPVKADTDSGSVTLGLKLTTKVSGKVTGLRFYKGTGNTGTHVGALYSASGAQLAKATYGFESASGWQSVSFSSPVTVAAGVTLTAATLAPKGHYPVQAPYPWPKSGASLNALAGVYRYGSGISFPSQTYKGSNYFVDVNFTAGSTPVPTPSPTPTVTPSPSPPPTATPTSSPTPGAFPGASNTGVPAGVTLAPSGGLTITQAGTVVNGKDITGSVVVRAPNVTIKNSRIKGSGAYCVQTQSGGSVTIEDSEIVGGCENAIGFDDWTARRVEIRGTYGDGVKLGSDVLLQDSWIHDLTPASGAHADGGQVQSGVSNTVIRHNAIDLGSTGNANAALFLAPDLGPSTDGPLTIDGNKLNGGNYTVFCVDGNNGQYFVKNITFTGNRFGDDFQYGRSNVNVPITQSGNLEDSSGAAYSL